MSCWICYVAELCYLSEHCDFGSTLNDMLWDRLVCDVADSFIQWSLLTEEDISFIKIYKKAVALESVEKSIQDLSPPTQAHAVSPNKFTTQWSGVTCTCGGVHKASDCRFKNTECHKCGKIGHLACVCRSQFLPIPDPIISSTERICTKCMWCPVIQKLILRRPVHCSLLHNQQLNLCLPCFSSMV